MGRRLISRRPKALIRRPYAVLAEVSLSYSPPGGRYLRVTHPSAAPGRSQALDLHVLSRPLAFALSQDQTLQFNRCYISCVFHKACETAVWFSRTGSRRPKSLKNRGAHWDSAANSWWPHRASALSVAAS